ncbi:saccharopine dehydrogenase protein [Rhizobium etli 8C-3]|uniref:Saccharopine dehydrogenase protein n=1 Tax=Rhizobium etli 8C-3 TaxID=538025 RepID=A0A1L5P151_RHIET|nr:SDR family oxidoreductase [Rhizobium etli]APO73884.1 saccharopine dehydrogenase protein [Rhizobium etli 8C-3]
MSDAALRILIIGGYGTFGARLAQLLCDDERFCLLIAGRSLAKAVAFVTSLGGKAGKEPVEFDRNGDVYKQLSALRPAVTVDASGPFQTMGDSFRVPRACISLGIDYADLADSREFVRKIAALDAEARAARVFVLSGLSSFPALSFAALDRLAQDFSRIDHVSSGIAPSPHADVGPNVVQAIASYAGKPVPILRNGRSATGHGLIDWHRVTVAPPGCIPLKSRCFRLVDAPDLDLLPQRFEGLCSVFTGAATTPQILQRLLAATAQLVRIKLLSSLLAIAPLMHRASKLLATGEHRGGMFVHVSGADRGGKPLEASWHLVAEGDDGPFIPVAGLEALIRKLANGNRPADGARSADGEFPLQAFERCFKRFAIQSGTRQVGPADVDLPLYRRLLGSAWERLPRAIAATHDTSEGGHKLSGRASVERGTGLLASIIAAAVGFPKAQDDVAVSVCFTTKGRTELWTRDFGGAGFGSVQLEGNGRDAHLLAEDFGPFRILMAVVPDGAKLRFIVRGWRFFGIPLPLVLAPRGDTYEEEREGRFHFHVEVGGPLTGLIVSYAGWLEKDGV